MKQSDLFSLYTKFTNPGSFSGVDKFYNHAKLKYPSITKKEVRQFLRTQDAYTLHKPKK